MKKKKDSQTGSEIKAKSYLATTLNFMYMYINTGVRLLTRQVRMSPKRLNCLLWNLQTWNVLIKGAPKWKKYWRHDFFWSGVKILFFYLWFVNLFPIRKICFKENFFVNIHVTWLNFLNKHDVKPFSLFYFLSHTFSRAHLQISTNGNHLRDLPIYLHWINPVLNQYPKIICHTVLL